MQRLDNKSEFHNLTTMYIVALDRHIVGAKSAVVLHRDDVLKVDGPAPVSLGAPAQVLANVHGKDICFWADNRFRYAYKNEEKLHKI